MSRVMVALALLATFVFPPSASWAQTFKGQKLRVQFWGGSDALAIQRYVVEPFEKETGASVVVENGNTSASIAKVRAQKADPQLDVVMLDDIGVLTLAREGVLDRLDLSKLPLDTLKLAVGVFLFDPLPIHLFAQHMEAQRLKPVARIDPRRAPVCRPSG